MYKEVHPSALLDIKATINKTIKGRYIIVRSKDYYVLCDDKGWSKTALHKIKLTPISWDEFLKQGVKEGSLHMTTEYCSQPVEGRKIANFRDLGTLYPGG